MEQKSFADIFEDVTKQAVKIQKKDYLPTGRYPIIDQGQEWCAGYTDREDGLFQDVPAYIFGDHTRIIKYTDEPFYLGADGVKLLKLREGIQANPRFFYYALKSQRIPDTGYNRHFKWLKESLYHVPTLNEQTHIADTLDTLSTLITLCKMKIFLFDELVKSRFVEMFGDPVTNPMGWEIKSLSDMGDYKNGMNFHKGENGIKLHCLGVGDFQNLSIIDDTSTLPIISLNAKPSKEYLLQNDDIVFVRSNGNKNLVGRCLAVYPNEIPTVFSGFCIRFRLAAKEQLTIGYLLQVLKHESMRQRMTGRGVNIQNLNQQILSRLDIPLPPLSLQNEFAAFVEQADKSKLVLRQLLEKQRILKAALMQEYFAAK